MSESAQGVDEGFEVGEGGEWWVVDGEKDGEDGTMNRAPTQNEPGSRGLCAYRCYKETI